MGPTSIRPIRQNYNRRPGPNVHGAVARRAERMPCARADTSSVTAFTVRVPGLPAFVEAFEHRVHERRPHHDTVGTLGNGTCLLSSLHPETDRDRKSAYGV